VAWTHCEGKLNIVEGDPKTGKSTLVLDLVARVTTGSSMPDGAPLAGLAAVVLMTAEDGLADTASGERSARQPTSQVPH